MFFFDKDQFKRVGFGIIGLKIGKKFGINSRTSIGSPLLNKDSSFFLSFDIPSSINLDNENYNNYYMLNPSLGVSSKTKHMYVNINGGGSINSIYKRKLLKPDINKAFGLNVMLYLKKLSFNYAKEYFYTKKDFLEIYSFSLFLSDFKKLNFSYENKDLNVDEKVFILSITDFF